jgi:hypothetical protein
MRIRKPADPMAPAPLSPSVPAEPDARAAADPVPRPQPTTSPSPAIPLAVWIYLALGGLTLAAYGHVHRNEFVNYDDPTYVTNNPHLRDGLTVPNLWWALTHFYFGNWHPATLWSYQLDHTLNGLNPAGYHVTNLVLHLANVLLLFGVLRRLTGETWPSAAVAAFWAVHPLHVESVAWVSERKDVLSTFFGLLALGAYARYATRPNGTRYLAVMVLFALSLMAKAMLVTLPFILLLLDYWPLRRNDERGTMNH